MEVKTSAGASTLREREQDAAEFLIDTRRFPPELRWKIAGMVEAVNLFNMTQQPQPPQPPTRAAG